MNWMHYPNFSESEFRCSHCGECNIDEGVVSRLQDIRASLNFPLPITSGYRCPTHNNAVSSTGLTGPHTTGMAVDVGLDRLNARLFLELAIQQFNGIGIQQKGEGRFIHVDLLDQRIWSY